MPTYTYRREDGSTFEITQRITEPALETCPTTGQQVSRIITGGTGLVFKGSGFYLTDYARKGASPGGESKTASSDSGSKSTDTSSDKAPKESTAATSDSSASASTGSSSSKGSGTSSGSGKDSK